jgi:plastocyanin
MQRFLILASAFGLLACAAVVGVASGKDSFQLKGEVYASGFKIEMETAAGRRLKTIKAGTYRIKIEDRATVHNFHLKGPRIDKATSVKGRSETIWRLRLRPGTYRFFCDPHSSMMRGSFRVTRG